MLEALDEAVRKATPMQTVNSISAQRKELDLLEHRDRGRQFGDLVVGNIQFAEMLGEAPPKRQSDW
jgi:hypothetical protein